MLKVLLLTDRLKYACGVTTHLYNLIRYSDPKKIQYFLIAAPGDRVNDFKELNIDIFLSERISYENRSLLNIILATFAVLRISIKYKINVLHSHNHYVAAISNFVKKIIKIKTVQTQHNLFPQGKLRQFNSDRYIVVNKDMIKIAIKKYGVGKDKIFEIRYGIHSNNEWFEKIGRASCRERV